MSQEPPPQHVIAAFEAADAAVAPIYDAEDHLGDPQVQALEMVTTVNDDDLGPLRRQNVLFRMVGTERLAELREREIIV
jgi:crotonobetainyl-CoA:carnitine CoA-transferase CaiB-like acyl-CoA transferase